MVDLDKIGEISFKPSEEKVRRDILEWTTTLIRVSNAIDELEISESEKPILEGIMGGYLAASIAGTLSEKHRDRAALDKVSLSLKDGVKKYVSDLEEKDIIIDSSRLGLIGRAANLVTSAYITGPDNDRFERIRNSIKFVKRTQ